VRTGFSLFGDAQMTSPDAARVTAAAFKLLVETGEPVQSSSLALNAGLEPEQVAAVLDGLRGVGDIREDASARLIGIAGLSVLPDRHEIHIGGRRLWTWCAYDILGIFGAFRASGVAISQSPATGKRLVVSFRSGLPQPSEMVLLRPDLSGLASCANVYEEWCPNSNLFEDAEEAAHWSREHGLEGRVLDLSEAGIEAAEQWQPLVEGVHLERAG
jgi:alkylmercury lyase